MDIIQFNKIRTPELLGALISLTIFGFALQYLYNTLHSFDINDIYDHFLMHSAASLFIAVSLTAASYFAVTGYDVLALTHIKRKLAYRYVAVTAFIASVFGNNLGFALLTGTSIRYRLYSQVGLSAPEIAGVSSICALSTTLGMGFIFGFSMLFQNRSLSETAFSLPPQLLFMIGVLVLTVIFGYIVTASFVPVALKFKNRSIQFPNARIVLAQTTLATFNLLLVGTIIYYLIMPYSANTGFLTFIGVFSLAIIAGSASNVPGGVGVFESVLMAGLPAVPPDALLGCILLFRCVYYLAPLGIAASLLMYKEFSTTRSHIKVAQQKALDWLESSGSQIMALVCVFAGTLLLLTSAIPPGFDRLSSKLFVPLPFLEIAQLLGTASGTGLLIVARDISFDIGPAYKNANRFLFCGIGASIVYNFNFTVLASLAFVAFALGIRRPMVQQNSVGSRSYQYPYEWILLIFVIITSTIWIGLFAHKDIAITSQSWTLFSYEGDFSRFLRVMSIVLAIIAVYSIRCRSKFVPPDNPSTAIEHCRSSQS